MPRPGMRRKRRDSMDQGVTFGQSAIKDTVEKQKVSVQGIISQAHRLADVTERKILKKKASLETNLVKESNLVAQLRLKEPQNTINAIANLDERAFVVAEKRKKYEVIVRDHPDKIRYWIEYADFEEKTMMSIDRCREIYDRAIAYHANNVEMIIHRGRLEERTGNAERAVDVYTRIGLKKFPKESKFYYRIALLKERLGLLDQNPFDEWISRVCPPSIGVPTEDHIGEDTQIRQLKSPIEESVPHFAFEHAIEWTVRTQKTALKSEVSANRQGNPTLAELAGSNSVASQVKLACQKYVCAFNDSTSWGYYATIESEVLKNPDHAELVYRAGIQSIPSEYLGKNSSKRHYLIMKLKLLKDFLHFLINKGKYQKRKHFVRDIWNSQFTLSKKGTSTAPTQNVEKYPKLSVFLSDRQSLHTEEDESVELLDEDFVLAQREEDLYSEVCNMLCSAEETATNMNDSAFIHIVQSDQRYMQHVRHIERLVRHISLLVKKDWISDANPHEDVTSIQSVVLELVPALNGLMQAIGNGFAEKDAMIDTVFVQVFRIYALVNGKLLHALRLLSGNVDSLLMRTVCFVQEQRRVIELLCDIGTAYTVDISKNLYIKYISLLEKLNELLLRKISPRKSREKSAPRGGRFHPTIICLAKPIWIRLASLELQKSPSGNEGFRRLMGGTIGKSCGIGDFIGSLKYVWETYCEKQDFTSPFLKDFPWQCPCRYRDPLTNLNGLFQFYLAQERTQGDSDRIHMIMSSWQEKSGTMSKQNSAILTKAHQHANLSTMDEKPLLARTAMKEERRVLLSLYLYFCLKETQWAAWLFDSHAGSGIHMEENNVDLLFDNVHIVSEVTQLLLPFRKGSSLKISEMLENIPAKTFNFSDLSTPAWEQNGLLASVSTFTDTISAMLALSVDDNCRLCGKGVALDCVEKRKAAYRTYARRVHADDQIENMKGRVLNGDMLTPTTENWSRMSSTMKIDAAGSNANLLLEKFEKICIQRVERVLSTVWSCAAVRHCLFEVESNSMNETHKSIPTEVYDFVRRHNESIRSQGSTSGETRLYCTVPNIFEGNLIYLVNEIRVWLRTILSKLRCLNFPLCEGEIHDASSAWQNFVEAILLCTQFVIFSIGLFTATPLLAETSMRRILQETPEEPDKRSEEEPNFASLKEIYDRLHLKNVLITSDSCDTQAEETETLISYCIHPLRTSSEYLGKVQILLDSRFDDTLNLYQEMLAETTRAYVEILLSWRVEDINIWKKKLAQAVHNIRDVHREVPQNVVKKYKLFDIAKSHV